MDTIGYFVNNTNTVPKNNESVILLSSMFANQHGFYILKDSILKASIVFTARKLITGKYHTWLNDHDNYLVPRILLHDKEV